MTCTAWCPAVFGWFADSFAGVESDTEYGLEVNYQKRPPSLIQFLSFDIVVVNQNSAGKWLLVAYESFLKFQLSEENNDFFVSRGFIQHIPTSGMRSFLTTTFLRDNKVEQDETFALRLVSNSMESLPSGTGAFFIETLQCIIVDGDGECWMPSGIISFRDCPFQCLSLCNATLAFLS